MNIINIASPHPFTYAEHSSRIYDHRTGDEFQAALTAFYAAEDAWRASPDYKPLYSPYNDRRSRHVAWCKAVQTKDFTHVDENMVLGTMYFVLFELLEHSRHNTPWQTHPETFADWDFIMDRWIEAKGVKMASLLPPSEHPDLHAALLDTDSELLNKIRQMIRAHFSYSADLRMIPFTEEEKANPDRPLPLMATDEIFQLASERTRSWFGISLNENDVLPPEFIADPAPQTLPTAGTGTHIPQSSIKLSLFAKAKQTLVQRGSRLFRPFASKSSSSGAKDISRLASIINIGASSDPIPAELLPAQVDSNNADPSRRLSLGSKKGSAQTQDSGESDRSQQVKTPPGGVTANRRLPPTTPEATGARGASMKPVVEDKGESGLSR